VFSMNRKEQIQFAQRCAVLLESGISLSEVVVMVKNLERRKKYKIKFELLNENILRGTSFFKSLLHSGFSLSPMLLSMLNFGESSGLLPHSLRQAAEVLEKSDQIRRKLIGALIYPGFIAMATVGMTVFLVMYIFPKIIPLFSSMNIDLPLITRLVKSLYEGTIQYGMVIGSLLIVLITSGTILYKKNNFFRYKIQFCILRSPIIGLLLQKYKTAVTCKIVGTLLESGQTLPKILEQVATTEVSGVYKEIWRGAEEQAQKGISLSTSLQKFKFAIPIMIPDMLKIGERTGTLSHMFLQISKMYEEELDEFVKQLNTVIEPVLMIGMGLIVGSVALSIILPIYEITNHLTH
jgi:type IV pilus assembly protein PilC